MSKIHVLDQITIDKIAAGEVIERPASIVKELAENSIDAGASSIVVEIKEGGISFIRITDNGCGIAKEDVANAFLRHSTSKITSADDLMSIHSLGFRGEALSSIAAVSQVELITKPRECTYGISYRIEGGREVSLDETGAPDGSTFLVRQLFYNTPARRKFLKTPMTEASHVGDIITRLALSHPEISFQFINNGQSKIHTSGNGEIKDAIYHIYGREIASHLIKADACKGNLHVKGYIGEPLISRGNRNFENYYINGRYIKSNVVSKAIEDAYKDFSMQHKYPFVVLYLDVDTQMVDVNVHPTKMEVRFGNQQEIYNFIYEAVTRGLKGEELIPIVEIPEPPTDPSTAVRNEKKQINQNTAQKGVVPAQSSIIQQNEVEKLQKKESKLPNMQSVLYNSSETQESTLYKKQSAVGKKDLDYFMNCMRERVTAYHTVNHSNKTEDKIDQNKAPEVPPVVCKANPADYETNPTICKTQENLSKIKAVEETKESKAVVCESKENISDKNTERIIEKQETKQMNLFEDKLLDIKSVKEHRIIGQLFDTYWLVQYKEQLYIIDQHAAHERVLYEKTLRGMKNRDYTSQNISPPIILELSMKESELLNTYMDQFTRIGFEFESFGPDSYAVCAIPDNLFGIAKKELLIEMIDMLSDEIYTGLTPDVIDEKIASMSCKAAVKGRMKLSAAEATALIDELLTLDNPYHCPHGRPTIISITKRELEKKFKRII